VESRSEHPLARAILAEARSRGLRVPSDLEGFQAVRGRGVKARLQGNWVRMGSARFLQSEGIPLRSMEGDAPPGSTVVHLAVGESHVADFYICDPVRPTTPEAIRLLREAGLRLVMLTGDRPATARAVANSLKLQEFVADVMPESKLEHIRRLQQDGAVAFVGDGLNDAPALAAADVGLAIGGATDIARESAEVVLVDGDLRKTATALRLSRATLRNIRQNLFWAFAYNTLLIPVAAGALYPFAGILLSPVLAAGAMALSSLCVVGNALRLARCRL
jgi:P-type E1-E2 ATPase